ncbi:DUF5642 family protein [Mycolicibacterium sp.]|uniref:DUF5642 family protein n=1 Tax=Mycolicibacterium sp. TaxID=2320850 RepID=UPI00355FB4EB
MRLRSALGAALLLAGCGAPGDQDRAAPPSSIPAAAAPSVDPARVKRMRGALPAGDEVQDVVDVTSPVAYWGMRPGWTAQPAPCAALVNGADGGTGRGLASSGDGGQVYVVIATAPSGRPLGVDPALLDECAQWSAGYGRSTASVRLIPAPPVEAAVTVGMSAEIRTVVESGTETDSQASTYLAYLDAHLIFVTLILDPGSPHPPLPSQYAAELLVNTVATARG